MSDAITRANEEFFTSRPQNKDDYSFDEWLREAGWTPNRSHSDALRWNERIAWQAGQDPRDFAGFPRRLFAMKSQVADALLEEHAQRSRADAAYIERLRGDPARLTQVVVREAVHRHPGISRDGLLSLLDIDAADLSAALRALQSHQTIARRYDESQGIDGYYDFNRAPNISLDEKRSRYRG